MARSLLPIVLVYGIEGLEIGQLCCHFIKRPGARVAIIIFIAVIKGRVVAQGASMVPTDHALLL